MAFDIRHLIALALATGLGTGTAVAEPARVTISVTGAGFTPAEVHVPNGKPTTLVFVRKTERTCAKEVVLEVGGKKIERQLPLDQPVEIKVTFPKAGKLTYACGMDMVRAYIIVN